MPTKTYAVLVADIVGSSSLPDLRPLLSDKLRTASATHRHQKLIRLPYSVTAGDEFQTIIEALPKVPFLISDLRRRLRPFDLRIGVGLGSVNGKVKEPVNRIGGQAFQLARSAIESVKKNASHKFKVLTAFRSSDEVFDTTANLIYALHDTLILNTTKKQWATVDAFWDRGRLDDTATALNLDASTVSRNLKRAYYWQSSETIKGMAKIIENTFF
jgi:SatD family (SatD)